MEVPGFPGRSFPAVRGSSADDVVPDDAAPVTAEADVVVTHPPNSTAAAVAAAATCSPLLRDRLIARIPTSLR
ncbi:hypothetical protein GCM10009751_08340 [Myceligenerans crystallogenes]|uniref:Uncharacterized protein n=1 Tax=Myceligenerans crystallogenes TaxID=316335 RepID=A0ABN2N5Q1_9MICO